MNKVNICFVVLHYNTIEDTERFIVSVFENIDVDSFQIVIVDNASPNRSGEILKEKYRENDKVSVILNSTNKGFARGNNTGIKYAEKNFDPDFIVMTNSDTYLIQKDFYYQIQKEYEAILLILFLLYTGVLAAHRKGESLLLLLQAVFHQWHQLLFPFHITHLYFPY